MDPTRYHLAQPSQSVFGLRDGRTMPGGHPPHRHVAFAHDLEPLAPAAKDRDVRGLVDVRGERLDRLPDRHVQEDVQAELLEDPKRGRVALFGLKAPDEARAVIGDRVDRVKPGGEVGDER